VNSSAILETDGLCAFYRDVQALHAVNLSVGKGELVAVLGANGAGKSTLLRSIMGLVSISGTIRFHGQALPRRHTVAAARRGIVLVPEGRGIFGPMSVAENLQLGAYTIGGRGAEFRRRRERVLSLFPRLAERLAQAAGSMSGGEQQMLAIGRALMAAPQLLLLDEPSLGLAPKIAADILETLGRLNRDGLSVVLVEQKAPLALGLARRAYIMSNGRVTAAVDPGEIKLHDQLAHHYLA
jgi:branched-chain amino acid transport system ATP-binding protein